MDKIADPIEWRSIHDPKGEIDFHMEWTFVSSQYMPEEIQEMIEKTGVQGMVRTVNEHMKMIHGRNAMVLGYVGNRKAVIQA